MIGNLLAQITGEPVQQTTTPPASKPLASLKRKADDDTRNNSAKAPRLETNTKGTGSSASNLKPTDRPASTPYRGTAMSRPTGLSKATSSHTVKPASTSTSAKPPSSTNGTNGARSTSAAVRKGPAAPATTAPSSAAATEATKSAPPKKGSYAEILARAKLAQATMGQVGKIQHKEMTKKKEPPELKRDAKQPVGTPTSRYQGAARPAGSTSRTAGNPALQRRATSAGAISRDPKDARNLGLGKSKTKRSASVAEEEPKRVKKAALATTGYTGTARPRAGPTASATSRKPAAPGGALLNPHAGARYGGSARRSRYKDEEEDDDLDDFIEYDDEEEQPLGGPRYRYDSGSESDMEAGMDDIYEEEERAARAARLEDLEQERLEKRLKAEKEERKRRFLEEQKRRGRA